MWDNFSYPYINYYFFKIFYYFLDQKLIKVNFKEADLAGNDIDFDYSNR